MWRTGLVFVLLLVCGCADRHDTGPLLAEQSGWEWSIIPTGDFELATAQNANHADTLWLYIEGDGQAFTRPSQPAMDPTPIDPIALHLALAQPGDAAIGYLARPCQYVENGHRRGCSARYWTDARYAADVVSSLNTAADAMKKRAGASHIILTGYSGGGALAVLMAAERHDVAGIVTVASNLDLDNWTKSYNLMPLTGSLNPADKAQAVALIPQIHFTGARDDIVGTNTVRSYMQRLPPDNTAQLIEIPDFDHHCCWAQDWPQLFTDQVQKFSGRI